MCRGKQKDLWAHTAHVITTLVNFSAVRDPKKTIAFADVYPFAERRRPVHDMQRLREEWLGMIEQQRGPQAQQQQEGGG